LGQDQQKVAKKADLLTLAMICVNIGSEFLRLRNGVTKVFKEKYRKNEAVEQQNLQSQICNFNLGSTRCLSPENTTTMQRSPNDFLIILGCTVISQGHQPNPNSNVIDDSLHQDA